MLKAILVTAALLAAFSLATIWQAARVERAARAAYPPEGDFVEVNGARVHYVTRGEGPDLVLIHGSSGNTRDFTYALTDMLADRYRVTVFDRPGLGYSDRLDPDGESLAQQARHLADAAHALGIENAIVLGQSYGGAVALAWALERPGSVAGLVLVSAASNPWETGLGLYYTVLSSALGRTLLVPLMTAWLPERLVDSTLEEVHAPQTPPEGYAGHIGAPLSLTRSALRANALQRRNLLAEIEAQSTRYPAIDVPAEILHGTDDQIVPLRTHAEPLARQLPEARLTTLPGIGHMPHHAVPEDVAAAIDRAARRAGLTNTVPTP